jgi:hypothetical protein
MRYTAVFEWPDEANPPLSSQAEWLGGKLVSVQFSDAFAERDRYRAALQRIADEYPPRRDAQALAEWTLRGEMPKTAFIAEGCME